MRKETKDKLPPVLRDEITKTLFARDQKEEILYGIEKFKDYLFREVHTYTLEQFRDSVISKFEIQEQA